MRTLLALSAMAACGLALSAPATAQPPVPQLPLKTPLPVLRPDLMIKAMVPVGPTVRICVANIGLADTTNACWLRVWDVKQQKLVGVRWAFTPPLKKGTSIWVSVNFAPLSLAHSTLFARVDYFNVIAESNELNNGATKVI